MYMYKATIFLMVITLLIVAGCKSYPPEVQNKLAECKKVIDYGDCKMAIAIEQNDASICGEVNNRYYAEVCKILVSRDFGKCSEISNWAFEKRDITKFTLTPSKSDTIKTCYVWSAILSKDVTKCNGITSDYDKTSCIMGYAHQMNDTLACDKISDDYYKKLCKEY